MTKFSGSRPAVLTQRRRFLRFCGGAAVATGGLQLLSACKDDVVGEEAVARPPLPTTQAVPAYTATDNDRINFTLQIHYLLAAFLQMGIYGTSLPPALVSGSGTAGTVRGGSQVSLTDTVLAAQLREIAESVIAQIGWMRRTLGSAVTAQPAIDIRGGEGSPFQAIAVSAPRPGATPTPTPTPAPTPSAKPPVFFDPYKSETDFLLGAAALTSVAASATVDVGRQVALDLAVSLVGLAASAGAREAVIRAAILKRAIAEEALPEAERGTPNLYDRFNNMAGARDSYDGERQFETGIGWIGYPEILGQDGSFNGFRRTPEQALGVLYASSVPVRSGAFFPAGVNGVIQYSGSNQTS